MGPSPSFTTRDFRNAMGIYPTGVAVVTAQAENDLIGVTVNSLCSVSLEPPLLSFNLAFKLRSSAIIRSCRMFAVNILRDDQQHLSVRFSGSADDKWKSFAPATGLTGAPVIESAAAVFECEHFACHEAGDHIIALGRVLQLTVAAEARPLVFYRSSYCRIGP